MSMKVSIVGSHGLYASYGGWDQLVINLAERKDNKICYSIFNPKDTPVTNRLPDVFVKQLPFSASGGQGLLFDVVSLGKCFSADVILMLGMRAMPAAVLLKIRKPRLKLIVNIGGVEWKRPQFNKLLKLYLQFCLFLTKKFSTYVVIDNGYFLNFFDEKDKKNVKMISYGGEINEKLTVDDLLGEFNFLDSEYYLSISRSIKDNKIEELCSLFSKCTSKKLVLISNFSNSDYGRSILDKYNSCKNMILIDGLYDKPKLDLIRRKCKAYIHTHTLCGSAPSLIEMIVCRVPIYSIDVIQNRYTLRDQGLFFRDFKELRSMLEDEHMPKKPSNAFAAQYDWRNIVSSYELLILS